jgi:hypothetical protein
MVATGERFVYLSWGEMADGSFTMLALVLI